MSNQVVSCGRYNIPKLIQRLQGNFPCMFDYGTNPVDQFLILKSSIDGPENTEGKVSLYGQPPAWLDLDLTKQVKQLFIQLKQISEF